MQWIALLLACASLSAGSSYELRAEEKPADETPSQVALNFLMAMIKADLPAMQMTVTEASQAALVELQLKGASVTDKPKIVEEKITDNRATVSVIVAPGEKQPEQLPLVRVDGQWRVDFVAYMEAVKPKLARAAVAKLHNLLIVYSATTKSLPTMQQGLNVLLADPNEFPFPSDRRPRLKKIELDPWGSPYRYEIPAKRNKFEKFDVFSIGPDKQPYTEDDIGTWQ